MRKFFAELKRRHVYRVAVLYAALAWLFVQIADIVLENFNQPERVMQLIIWCAALGFPLALILAWIYDIRSSGIHRTPAPDKAVEESCSATADSTEAASGRDERPGIVVLPIENVSGETADEIVCSGLTADLTTMLAHLSGFFVISRNTALFYQGQKKDTREIGRELGVRYLLEGSLRRKGDHLRITAQLIEAENGSHLWAEKYDTPLDGLEEVQDRLTQSIALQLGSELSRAEYRLARRRLPKDTNAWSLYQNAKGTLMFKGWSQESISQAAAQLREAIALEPDYAAPQAYLSLLLAMGYWIRLVDDRPAAHDESVAAADRALALEPDSSEILGFVGCAYSDLGYKQRGIPLLEKAIELDASNAQAQAALGAALIVAGELERGIAALTTAVEISPKDPGLAMWATILAAGSSLCGDVERAEHWAGLAYKADSRFFPCLVIRAWVQLQHDQLVNAQTSLDEAVRLYPKLHARYINSFLGNGSAEKMRLAGLIIAEG